MATQEFARYQELERERPHIATSLYYPTGGIIDNAQLESWQIIPNPNAEQPMPLTAQKFLDITGIERRYRAAPHETVQYMAEQVAEDLIEQSGAPDVILVSTSYPTGVNISGELVKRFGLGRNVFHGDIHAACSGYAKGLAFLGQFPEFFDGRKVMIIGSENYEHSLEPLRGNGSIHDTSLAETLFSTGAGGQVFVAGESVVIKASRNIRLPRKDSQALKMPVNPEKMVPPYIAEYVPPSESGYFEQDGHAVFETVRTYIPNLLLDVIADAGLTPDEIDLVVGHQPSIKVLKYLMTNTNRAIKKDGFELDFYFDIEEGNWSSVAVIKAMNKAINEGRMGTGTHLINAFGAGFYGEALAVELH